MSILFVSLTLSVFSQTSLPVGGAGTSSKMISKPDSISNSTPLLSIDDLEQLDWVIKKQFDLTEEWKYKEILAMVKKLLAESYVRKQNLKTNKNK